jgi:hypothetical protein
MTYKKGYKRECPEKSILLGGSRLVVALSTSLYFTLLTPKEQWYSENPTTANYKQDGMEWSGMEWNGIQQHLIDLQS